MSFFELRPDDLSKYRTMAGTSGEKETDHSIRKLCEILSKIMEQPKVVWEVFKYALEPNPIKLQGQENYIYELGSTCSVNFELSWI